MKQSKILIYTMGALGDTIVCVPPLRVVRNHYGEKAWLCLLCDRFGNNARPTAQHVLTGSDYVNEYIHYLGRPTSFFSKVIEIVSLWFRLMVERFDEVVYLVPSERLPRSVYRDKIFFYLCGIFKQKGFFPVDRNDLYPKDENGSLGRVQHESVLRIKRLQESGHFTDETGAFSLPLISIPKETLARAQAWLSEQPGYQHGRMVAICPGTNQPANQWEQKNFYEIGHRIIQKYGLPIIVIGGGAERHTAEQLISEWGAGINAAGKFSVIESAAVLSLCRLTVGLDTGTTHLAAAVGVKCVAVYSSRNHPGLWEPLGEGHEVFRYEVPCGGCRLSECTVDGHPCLSNISVNEVWDCIEKDLKSA